MLTQSSCDNSSSTNYKAKSKDLTTPSSTNTSEQNSKVDSIVSDTTSVTKTESDHKDTVVKKSEESDEREEDNKAINIDEAVDIKKQRDVRDDPGYIGTPCELIEGECIRHDHSEQNDNFN